MTASSAEETSCGIKFLFSLNRINVAVSRAKGLSTQPFIFLKHGSQGDAGA